jgi:hypothetical protein
MSLENEIAAFDKMRRTLEAKHRGEWVVFHGGEFIGHFPDFQAAATEAEERFDGAQCLIRQVGVELVHVTSTMTFRPAHAHGSRGL